VIILENGLNAREKILTTASRLFQFQGYHATGLNQILKESGAPKGSLYYYFPKGKEELALESIKIASEFIQRKVKDILEKISDPVEAMESIFKNLARIIDEGDLENISIGLISLETYRSNECLRQACKDVYEAMENIYTEKLIQSGFHKDKAKEVAILIQIMIEGAINISLTKKDISPLLIVADQVSILLKH
jgi:TetR/AcrR family transcriptional regulator, lmrAB and yxaGH operons repressor